MHARLCLFAAAFTVHGAVSHQLANVNDAVVLVEGNV